MTIQGMALMLRVAPSVLLFLTAALPCAAQGTPDWVQPTAGVSIALDASDNVYTVDTVQTLGAEMILTKRDANGALLWQASYDQTDPTRWERASWVVTDSEGNAIVCGTSMSGYSNPVEAASIVIKFDAAGDVLWRQMYENDFDGSYTRRCLVDASDNVYVLGTGHGPAGYVTKVKKFAPDGSSLWSWLDSDGIGVPINFKFTPDGDIVISARSIYGSVNGYARIDRDGDTVWSLPGVFSLTAGDAAGDLLGNTYVVHGEYVFNPRTVVKKLDASGALIWENFYVLGGFRVEVGNDNRAVVSGFPNPNSGGAAFVKVDEDGGLLWSNLDADGPLVLLMHAHMLLDGANNAYLAAGTLSAMAVCKVNSDGSSGWTGTVTGGYANAIALGAGNTSVFVVGGGATARLRNAPGTPPAAPTNLRAQVKLVGTKAKVRLLWVDNATDETGYIVERCKGNACTSFAPIASLPGNSVSYVDAGVARATSYRYRVMATAPAGDSAYSNIVRVRTP